MKEKINIFWFRRDLRLNDNAGFFHALNSGMKVLPVFIFDTEILSKLSAKNDARVTFIYHELKKLKGELEKRGSTIKIMHSSPLEAFKQLFNEFNIHSVFTNTDYEPYAIERDKKIKAFVESHSCAFLSFKDQVIFEPNEVLKPDGNPYTIFTPYSKKWKAQLGKISTFQSERLLENLVQLKPIEIPALEKLGFVESKQIFPNQSTNAEIIKNYENLRDIPGIQGTSRLGVHLRFGTIGIRALVEKASKLSEVFLNELIWREFFMQILWHFPKVVNKAFKPKYDLIEWRNNEDEFKKWCTGNTGFPLVDAGMRELNETGFMHNRVRMLTASFLSKHLLIDWRWGEAYFAEKLLDYELAANNGNWQWAAGCGCDAAPYFRIFNPETQLKKFDPQLKYVLKWVPEFGTVAYPRPIVDHKLARERVLLTYKKALND